MTARHNRSLRMRIASITRCALKCDFTGVCVFIANIRHYLWSISVVEHAEDDTGDGVLGVRHVSWWGEGRQVVLQGLAQHAVEGNVRTKDVTLLPAVFLQLLDLSP